MISHSDQLHLSAADHSSFHFRRSRSQHIVPRRGKREYDDIQTVGADMRSACEAACHLLRFEYVELRDDEHRRWAPKPTADEASRSKPGTISAAGPLYQSTALRAFAKPFGIVLGHIFAAQCIQPPTFCRRWRRLTLAAAFAHSSFRL